MRQKQFILVFCVAIALLREVMGAPPPRPQYHDGDFNRLRILGGNVQPLQLSPNGSRIVGNNGRLIVLPVSCFKSELPTMEPFAVIINPHLGDCIPLEGRYYRLIHKEQSDFEFEAIPTLEDKKSNRALVTYLSDTGPINGHWIVPKGCITTVHNSSLQVEEIDPGKVTSAKVTITAAKGAGDKSVGDTMKSNRTQVVEVGSHVTLDRFSYRVERIVVGSKDLRIPGWVQFQPSCHRVNVHGSTYTLGARLDVLDIKIVSGKPHALIEVGCNMEFLKSVSANNMGSDVVIRQLERMDFRKCDQSNKECHIIHKGYVTQGHRIKVHEESFVVTAIEFDSKGGSYLIIDQDPAFPRPLDSQ